MELANQRGSQRISSGPDLRYCTYCVTAAVCMKWHYNPCDTAGWQALSHNLLIPKDARPRQLLLQAPYHASLPRLRRVRVFKPAKAGSTLRMVMLRRRCCGRAVICGGSRRSPPGGSLPCRMQW